MHRLGTGARRLRHVRLLELAPLVVAASALITGLLWSDIGHSTLSGTGEVTSLAYPVFYVAAALSMLQAVLSGAVDLRRNPGLAAMLTGVALEAIAFILWTPLLLDGSYAAGADPVDALWGIGMILIGVGARNSFPAVPAADFEHVSRRHGGILPSVMFVTLAALQIASIASHAQTGAELVVSAGITVVGATLTFARRSCAASRTCSTPRSKMPTPISARNHAATLFTGLGNRLRLREDSADLAARAERYGHRYSLVMIDLDHFKDYNDHHGHQAGDRALRQVAALLEGYARDGDRAYRYGGEELLLILPDQDPHTAQTVAERHLANLNDIALPHPENSPLGILTFSAGVATAQAGETPDQVLKRADDALYSAKNNGRNRVAGSETEALSELCRHDRMLACCRLRRTPPRFFRPAPGRSARPHPLLTVEGENPSLALGTGVRRDAEAGDVPGGRHC